MKNRLISDIGGLPEGPLDLSEHEPTMTERRIDAMMMLLRAKPRSFWASDENRRTIESLEPDTYKKSEYYERWVLACLLYTSPSPRDDELSRMPSSA